MLKSWSSKVSIAFFTVVRLRIRLSTSREGMSSRDADAKERLACQTGHVKIEESRRRPMQYTDVLKAMLWLCRAP